MMYRCISGHHVELAHHFRLVHPWGRPCRRSAGRHPGEEEAVGGLLDVPPGQLQQSHRVLRAGPREGLQVVDGQGLNITVQSYVDWLDFGLVACRELVPDLWDLLDMIVDDLYALADEAGLKLKR